MNQTFERVGVYKLEDVLPYAVTNQVVEGLFAKGLRRGDKEFKAVVERDYGGHMVKMDSLRYQLFATKGCKCVRCGIEGTFFSLERHAGQENAPQRYHFNLYATEPDGSWRLLTKDHIIPVCKGGKDVLPNLQVMCTKCNKLKDSNNRVKQVLVVLKNGRIESAFADDNIEVVVASIHGFETLTPEVGRKALVAAAKHWGEYLDVVLSDNEHERAVPPKSLLDLTPHK